MRYKSKYTNSDRGCSEGAYVAELLIERREKGVLPLFFWKDKRWARLFRILVIQANELINIYGEGSLIKVLSSKEGQYITSLKWKNEYNPKLITLLNKERAEKKEQEKTMEVTTYNKGDKIGKTYNKNSLGDLD